MIGTSWTFVQSSTYTTISIVVGLIVSVFLAALVIQEELLQGVIAGEESASPVNPGKKSARSMILKDDTPRRPRGRVAMAPMIICFGVIVILRLATLAYRRPDMNPTNSASPLSQSTAAPTSAADTTRQLTAAGAPAVSKPFSTDGRPRVQMQSRSKIGHLTNDVLGTYSGAPDSATDV